MSLHRGVVVVWCVRTGTSCCAVARDDGREVNENGEVDVTFSSLSWEEALEMKESCLMATPFVFFGSLREL
jgi:hypothetical protein